MHKIRIASFPASSMPNPYLELFYDALKPYGIYHVGGFYINDIWLEENATSFDVIHFHWPEGAWRVLQNGYLGSIKAIIGFFKFLRVAKNRNIKLLWTVHNLEHHEGVNWIDKICYRMLARNTDLLISHSYWAKSLIENWYPKSKVVVMYHGNYDGVYPEPRPKKKVLTDLSFDINIPMICCVGNVRNYKGYDLAVKAVNVLLKQNFPIQLLIAGKLHPKYNVNRLVSLIGDSMPYIKLLFKELNEQEFSDFVGASEAVLLPYRKITGSGAFLAALTLSRGVICSDLPYFREILGNHFYAGTLFETENITALGNAIKFFLNLNENDRIIGSKKIAERFAWPDVVRPVAEHLNNMVN
ncbi:glycosyltransferase [Desulfovulcanus sp.]